MAKDSIKNRFRLITDLYQVKVLSIDGTRFDQRGLEPNQQSSPKLAIHKEAK